MLRLIDGLSIFNIFLISHSINIVSFSSWNLLNNEPLYFEVLGITNDFPRSIG